MPRYEITSPSGQRFEISAPPGATQEQVLEYAQQQFAQQEAPRPTPQPAQQQEPPRTLLDALKLAYKGLGTGGPLGMIGQEAVRQGFEAIERGAYNVGGATTDALAGAGASPEVAAAGGYAVNVGVQAIPTLIGAAAGQATKPALQATGRRLMQSALKPGSKDLVSGRAAVAVDTMLREGVNVSPGGAAKLRSAIDVLKADIAGRIAQSSAQIGKGEPARQVLQTLDRLKDQVNPGADKAAILKVWDEFNKSFADKIPIQAAQAVKQGTYKALDDAAYAGIARQPADVEAQKALARGLRIAIEKELPEIAKLNQAEKNLITTLRQVDYRAAQSGNVNPGGLMWVASNPKAAAGFLADRSPRFKSILARILHNAAAPAAPYIGAAGGAAIGSDSATRE